MYFATSLSRLLLVSLMLVASGCVSVRTELEHTSHLLSGAPFKSDESEDGLSTINVIARWQEGRLYVEQGLGYKIYDEGFDGPDMTYTARFGVELWNRKK